jgi:glycyl-tRNA synthetase
MPDEDHHEELMALLKRRGFLQQSYGAYGGVAGFYEYGPLGSRLKRNLEDRWRRLYVHEEGMHEVSTPTVAPEAVFEASGHLDRFADPLVECQECGSSSRADKLLEEEGMEDAEALELAQVNDALAKHGVPCPVCGGDFGEAYHFNLMFETEVGPGSGRRGFLRPETAQGIFLAFPWLYRHNREKLPVGGVQIGKAYRNEISPRQAVNRLREFHQMEAEVFLDPEEKTWDRWPEVKDTVLPLLPRDADEVRETPVDEAVEEGVVGNEAVGYFLVRTLEYLQELGIADEGLRFRQHHLDEMSHYSTDTWDAELLSERFGWVEVTGIADRTDYDLSSHEELSGEEFRARRRFDEEREVEVHHLDPDPSKLGPAFREDADAVADALRDLDPDEVDTDGAVEVTVDGETHEVPPDHFDVVERTETVTGEDLVPHVVEPSYGLDRILFALLERAHDPTSRDWDVLRLPADLAPVSAAVLPLMDKEGMGERARELHADLEEAGWAVTYDDGGNIGRRYARMDEIGTPYCVTVDHETLEDDTVTIRDRDTSDQVRVPADDVAEALEALVDGDASLEGIT